jgi:hypothetical protein
MTPEEAHRRCQHALDTGDMPAAEFWLAVLHVLNDEAEDRRIAQAVRDAELYVMSQACRWWWPDAG